MTKFEARGRHIRLPAEIRADDGTPRVEGYAAVFDQETDIGGMFREVIERGAFSEAIPRDDVALLVDHEGLPLARSRGGEGTLELVEDDHGLMVRAALDPADPDVQRIVHKMERGDLNKMSFAFYAERQEWDEEAEVPLRRVQKAALRDVSIVTWPAYEGTEVGLRSLESYRKEIGAHNRAMSERRVAERKAIQEMKFRGIYS